MGLIKMETHFDELDGVAYADINNDGYDDILIHPTYQDNSGGFTSNSY